MKRRIIAVFLAAALAATLAGCKSQKTEVVTDGDTIEYDASVSNGAGASSAEESGTEEAKTSVAGDSGGTAARDSISVTADAEMSMTADDDAVMSKALGAYGGAGPGGTAEAHGTADKTEIAGDPADLPENTFDAVAGTLTAGEWKDNDNYDYFVEVLGRDEWKDYTKAWKLNMTKRFVVSVTSGQTAAKNVKAEMLGSKGEVLYTAHTDSYGKAYLYYDLADKNEEPKSLRVYAAGANDGIIEEKITEEELKAGGKTVHANGIKYNKLDVMFTTDTTGSMSDELEYLKKELSDIISRTAAENRDYDIRVSVNFYRDEGDEYVVRSFAFEGDMEKVQKQIDQQFADGGGDTPEALHAALEDSVKKHEWREDAVKLLFLTLDAPGHKDAQGVPESIRASVTEAAAKGIRIIPVAASGVDKETEFLLRAMAGATGGTYTFLTDDSGVGEAHLEPTIGDYNVKKLNELIIKIINEYCK